MLLVLLPRVQQHVRRGKHPRLAFRQPLGGSALLTPSLSDNGFIAGFGFCDTEI